MFASKLRSIGLLVISSFSLSVFGPLAVATQEKKTLAPPVVMSAQQDHDRLMSLLNITSLRRGADGRNAEAPNAANYDESKANPFPTLPDPLVLKNGKKVTTAKAWWNQRRSEIVEDFDRRSMVECPGKLPG